MAYTHCDSISYVDKLAKGAQEREVEVKPVSGVTDGYKVARGGSSVTGSLEVATGLKTVVQAVACLKDNPSLTGAWASVADSATVGNILLKVWKPTSAADCTPIAATVAVNVRWIAIGT